MIFCKPKRRKAFHAPLAPAFYAVVFLFPWWISKHSGRYCFVLSPAVSKWRAVVLNANSGFKSLSLTLISLYMSAATMLREQSLRSIEMWFLLCSYHVISFMFLVCDFYCVPAMWFLMWSCHMMYFVFLPCGFYCVPVMWFLLCLCHVISDMLLSSDLFCVLDLWLLLYYYHVISVVLLLCSIHVNVSSDLLDWHFISSAIYHI